MLLLVDWSDFFFFFLFSFLFFFSRFFFRVDNAAFQRACTSKPHASNRTTAHTINKEANTNNNKHKKKNKKQKAKAKQNKAKQSKQKKQMQTFIFHATSTEECPLFLSCAALHEPSAAATTCCRSSFVLPGTAH